MPSHRPLRQRTQHPPTHRARQCPPCVHALPPLFGLRPQLCCGGTPAARATARDGARRRQWGQRVTPARKSAPRRLLKRRTGHHLNLKKAYAPPPAFEKATRPPGEPRASSTTSVCYSTAVSLPPRTRAGEACAPALRGCCVRAHPRTSARTPRTAPASSAATPQPAFPLGIEGEPRPWGAPACGPQLEAPARAMGAPPEVPPPRRLTQQPGPLSSHTTQVDRRTLAFFSF